MSDLISRSELLKSFQRCYSGHLGMENSDFMMTFKSICKIINQQPTTYDIDKVVEKFDKKYNNSLWIKGNEEFSITRNELIEIVKQGGVGNETEMIRDKAIKWNNNSSKRVPYEFIDYVEGKREIGVNDDVCEWKIFDNSLTKEPQWVYETTCGKYVGEEHTSKAFVYCPYCSKKIKVVE